MKLTALNSVFLTSLSCLSFTVFAAPAKPTPPPEVTLRHALDGKSQDALATLVTRFNDSMKGQGRIVLQDARTVDKKTAMPVLALLNEDDSKQFFATRPTFMPLFMLMKAQRQMLDAKKFYPQMLDAVDTGNGQPQALPMGMSLPVLLINRGKVPNTAKNIDLTPRTWLDVQNIVGNLVDHGVQCPLTSSRFAWVHLENVASQHAEPTTVRQGKSERVKANGLMNVKHLALLASWQKSHYFKYFGPNEEGSQHFLQGDCAMITGESSLYVAARQAGMDVTIEPLPYHEDAYGAQREKVLPDGEALWVVAGQAKNAYPLAAKFVSYLMQPEAQRDWVRATGALPMTPDALAALRDSGMPAAMAEAADKRLSASRSNGSRIRPGVLRDRLRLAVDEQVALVWSTPRSAKLALDTATEEANTPPAAAPASKPAAKKSKKRT